jgi:hypothetical protein
VCPLVGGQQLVAQIDHDGVGVLLAESPHPVVEHLGA